MAGSYDVVTGALRTHARTLDDLAGELRAVLAQAGGVSLAGNAYGQIGTQAAAAVDALGRLGQDALRDGADALESAGSTVRETADAYERGDVDGAERLSGIQDGELSS